MSDVDHERNRQLGGMFHFVPDDCDELFFFLWWKLENEFVVHLEEHATLQGLCFERSIDANHCDLDQIRG